MSNLTSTFKSPEIYVLLHLNYLNFSAMLSLLYIFHSPPNTSLNTWEQLLFCTIPGKYKALHYHTVSRLEKATRDWQNFRQNIPGLAATLPTPIKHVPQPLQRHVVLRAVPGMKPLGPACAGLLLPRAQQPPTRAHRSSHWHTAGQLLQTANIIAERRESQSKKTSV